jgi:hypothetical protein
VVQACAIALSCTDREAEFQNGITAAMVRVRKLMTDINLRAKNATIVLVGYPRLFALDHGGCGGVFTNGEVDMLNRLADFMASAGQSSVAVEKQAGIKAGYIDMIPGLTAGVCSATGITSHLIGISFDTGGPGDFKENPVDANDNVPCPLRWTDIARYSCLSRSSFHPNAAGAADYATRVTGQLSATGYP